MLDDMLLLAQMEVGKFYLNVETLNVNEFIQTIVNEFQIATGATHQVQFKSTFDKSLHSDVRLLRQICANLISNAIKYSPLGSTVNVTLHDHEGKLALVVKDQGIGIPLADQARLFESFERGSNVGKIVGTGLGLAVVKRAVDVHLGTIHVESQVGAGTTFTVLIPNMQSGI
jgi:signal transduction histidine kinase